MTQSRHAGPRRKERTRALDRGYFLQCLEGLQNIEAGRRSYYYTCSALGNFGQQCTIADISVKNWL